MHPLFTFGFAGTISTLPPSLPPCLPPLPPSLPRTVGRLNVVRGSSTRPPRWSQPEKPRPTRRQGKLKIFSHICSFGRVVMDLIRFGLFGLNSNFVWFSQPNQYSNTIKEKNQYSVFLVLEKTECSVCIFGLDIRFLTLSHH